MEPNDEKLRDALILMMLIAESEQARREGRWISQEQLEKQLRDRFGV